jgi:outer membrane receptor protein involved in Fe transport
MKRHRRTETCGAIGGKMTSLKYLRFLAMSTVFAGGSAWAANFNIPGGDLDSALDAYSAQSGVQLIVSNVAVRNVRTGGVKGNLSDNEALSRILNGTGFIAKPDKSGVIGIVREAHSENLIPQMQLAATPATSVSGASLETVTVTSSKLGGDVQNIPISITAMSQEQLTQTQTSGGPDLVKQVPNLTFSKTNFSGYNIEIRGIGTQAISVTTDPAVAVAFNDTPFIRNHFFEQEFYDVSQVEVLRGPQGTLYGRNATAGVVNLVSAKPTDQFEAMASADIGNYQNRRLEGMLNIPIFGDKLDLRLAGEWTKRKGYSFNAETDQSVDGRDLWSGRMSVLIHPIEQLSANLIWEHFSEDDDRLRSGKQLCTRDNGPSVVNGPAGPQYPADDDFGAAWLTQGCKPGSLYGPSSFQTPNAAAIPFVAAAEYVLGFFVPWGLDPYAGVVQANNLRTIDSLLEPKYTAKNDTLELNAEYDINSALTLTSQTGYNKDTLYSTEDYNRFNTAPGIFIDANDSGGLVGQDGQYCDPQLGCSTRMVSEDVSQEHAWQFSQEVRLASNLNGPLNFSAGANFMHYQTVEDYYVFNNLISLLAEYTYHDPGHDMPHDPFDPVLANNCNPIPADPANIGQTAFGLGCAYVDPNPLDKIDGQGHNYFRSQNPYRLNSYAGFGEVYYQLMPDVKLTGGLRWTDDRKHFEEIPSWTLDAFKGYPVTGIIDQEWKEWTGRFVANWTPKLDFTDQSLFYGSYSRGYKGGGANPPGVIPICEFGLCFTSPTDTTHPLTFKPEFVDAFEAGTKNTLLDGAMTLNADVFYYKYQNYQISQIVDRTSVNLNFNANVKGAEIETTWEPIPGLRFNLSGGYEDARLANGSQAIDLMDRTAGHAGWMVLRPYITETSNCILPTDIVNELLAYSAASVGCFIAYGLGEDPVTQTTYVPNPFPGYAGFDPNSVPAAANAGQGFAKNLSGNYLPNAPPFTLSLGTQYSMPLSADWVGTARADGYWQGNSFARIFNDKPYDQLHGYTNVNLSLIFTNQDGWQAMAYMKNVFNTTAITGAFLNSDDSALTTNVFVTDPRLFGLRITKNW